MQQCSAETICLNREFSGFEWYEDTANSDYLYNWQQEMGLMCMPRTTINYIVSAYFICYTVAGLLFFTIPDKIGVKKSMALFGTLHCLIQFIIILVPDYTVRLVSYGIMGACQLKNSVSYMWLFGLLQTKHKSVCCGIMNAWDTSTLTVTTLYFMYVSKDWLPIMLAATILATIGHLIMLFMPERPIWLL